MGWYAYMPFMECFHGVVSCTTDSREHFFSTGVSSISKVARGTSRRIGDDPSRALGYGCNRIHFLRARDMHALGRAHPLSREKFHRFSRFRQYRRGVDQVRHLHRSKNHAARAKYRRVQDHDHNPQRINRVHRPVDRTPPFDRSAPRFHEPPHLESVSGTITPQGHRSGRTVRFNERGTMAGIELSEADNLIL